MPTRYYGYTGLQNIMIIVHPLFFEDRVEFQTPIKGNITSFKFHAKNYATFIDIKGIKGYPFNR